MGWRDSDDAAAGRGATSATARFAAFRKASFLPMMRAAREPLARLRTRGATRLRVRARHLFRLALARRERHYNMIVQYDCTKYTRYSYVYSCNLIKIFAETSASLRKKKKTTIDTTVRRLNASTRMRQTRKLLHTIPGCGPSPARHAKPEVEARSTYRLQPQRRTRLHTRA